MKKSLRVIVLNTRNWFSLSQLTNLTSSLHQTPYTKRSFTNLCFLLCFSQNNFFFYNISTHSFWKQNNYTKHLYIYISASCIYTYFSAELKILDFLYIFILFQKQKLYEIKNISAAKFKTFKNATNTIQHKTLLHMD